ncbi:MAG: cache domain-containing protein [Gemmatimonadota bacterium]|nr:MAG: cache domain-containing protein [Gemmatimonadota bacterium]
MRRLVGTLAVAVIALALVIGAILARTVRSEVEEAKGYLLTLMELRRSALREYLETTRSEVLLWSELPGLRDAVIELGRAWEQLPDDPSARLQRLYIQENPYQEDGRHRLTAAADGSLYSRLHEAVHPNALRFIQYHGYDDVFLFDAEGHLLYTVAKEPDFATDFVAGAWRDTGLGRAFRAARDAESEDFVAFTDFEPYAPSGDEPASFVASAVRGEDGEFLGVLAFQIPVSGIDHIMQFTGGMGDTGETYLVGRDGLMRSDSRFSGTSTILRTRVDTEPARRALAGETGMDEATDYRGIPSLAAFGPFDFEGVRWAVVAEIDRSEVRGRALEPRRLLPAALLGLATVAALAAVALTYLMGRAERPEPWTRDVGRGGG